MTPTALLRTAATRLREMAEAATPGPWTADLCAGGELPIPHGPHGNGVWSAPAQGVVLCDETELSAADAVLIAALGPDAARILADTLDAEADRYERQKQMLWYQTRNAERWGADRVGTFVVPTANPDRLAFAERVVGVAS